MAWRLKLGLFLLLTTISAFSQGVRFDGVAQSTAGVFGQQVVTPIANPVVTVCGSGASGMPCFPQLQTFTDSTLGTPCAANNQVTLTGTSVCSSTGDSKGNFGFWLPQGNYKYTVTGAGVTGQLYNLTLPIATGGAASLGAITATAVNNVQCANATTTIASAYAALPSTGGVVQLCSDYTISSAQTVSLANNKPMKLDLAGRTITCTIAANGSTCLTINKNMTDPYAHTEIAGGGGVITYSGTATGIIGLFLTSNFNEMASLSMHDVWITGFNTASSIGFQCNGCEEVEAYSNKFSNNTLGVDLTLATNNTYFHGNQFRANVNALRLTDCTTDTFETNDFESNTGTFAVQVISTTQSVDGIKFLNNWFENNGDGTANARNIHFVTTGGLSIIRTVISGNNFIPDTNMPNTAFNLDITGAGSYSGWKFEHNFWKVGPGIETGFSALSGKQFFCVNDAWPTCDTVIGTGSSIAVGLGGVASPRGLIEMNGGVNSAPDALNANVATGVNILDSGNNIGIQIATVDSGTLRGYIQARNSVGANNTAYPLTLNELGGAVQVGGNLSPTVAGGKDAGTTLLPFGNLWLGTAATNNFKFQPAATAAARVITIADPLQTTVALPMTIVSGTKALNTASITTATCDAGTAATATGTLSTDVVNWSFNAAPTTANKYGSFLVVYAVPSANTVTFYTCNPSATTSTPTAMTVNFTVVR